LPRLQTLIISPMVVRQVGNADFIRVIDESNVEPFFGHLAIDPILHAAVFDQHLHDRQQRPQPAREGRPDDKRAEDGNDHPPAMGIEVAAGAPELVFFAVFTRF